MRYAKINMIFSLLMALILTRTLSADVPGPKGMPYQTQLKSYSTGKEGGSLNPVDPASVSSLQDVLQLTLLHHPALKSAAWQIEGKQALVSQSKLWTNPELETELENAGMDAFTINLGQLIELGGKRSARMSLAKLDRDASVWDYEIMRLNLLVGTGKQFIRVLESRQKISLLERSIDYAKMSYQTALERNKAGAASKIDVLQTQKDLEKTRLDLEIAERDYDRDLAQLAGYCGLPAGEIKEVAGILARPVSIPDYDDLVSELNMLPDIKAWMIRNEILNVLEKESKAQSVPDLNVNAGLSHQNDTGDNVFLLGLSIPLPVWDRNQGQRKAAEIDRFRSEFEKQELEIGIRHELLEKYTDLENTFNDITVYAGQILPMAKSTYREAREVYAVGKLSSLELLSYQKELLDNEMHYLEKLAAFYRIKYDLELLTGSEIRIEMGE